MLERKKKIVYTFIWLPIIQHKPSSTRPTRFFTLTFSMLQRRNSRRHFFPSPSSSQLRRSIFRSLPYPRSARRRRRRRSGSGSHLLRQQLPLPHLASRLALSPPVFRTLAGDPACVPLSVLPPPVDPQRRPVPAPGGCAARSLRQREPATAAPPRRSRCFGIAYAPKRSVTVLLALQRIEACS
jgi:hypothetical protein